MVCYQVLAQFAFYTALVMEIISVYFRGEVADLRSKVRPLRLGQGPSLPPLRELCPRSAPELLPVNFSWSFVW
jgi:hypothetical protein